MFTPLATSKAVNYRAGVVDVVTYSGHLSAKEGRLQEAVESYVAAEDLARRLGNKLKESWVTSGLAYVYDQSGDSTRALEYYQRTLRLRLAANNLRPRPHFRDGRAYRELKEYPRHLLFEKAASLRRIQQWRFSQHPEGSGRRYEALERMRSAGNCKSREVRRRQTIQGEAYCNGQGRMIERRKYGMPPTTNTKKP